MAGKGRALLLSEAHAPRFVNYCSFVLWRRFILADTDIRSDGGGIDYLYLCGLGTSRTSQDCGARARARRHRPTNLYLSCTNIIYRYTLDLKRLGGFSPSAP